MTAVSYIDSLAESRSAPITPSRFWIDRRPEVGWSASNAMPSTVKSEAVHVSEFHETVPMFDRRSGVESPICTR